MYSKNKSSSLRSYPVTYLTGSKPLLWQKSCHHLYWDLYTLIVDLEYLSNSRAHPSWLHSCPPWMLENLIGLLRGNRPLAVFGPPKNSTLETPCAPSSSLEWNLTLLRVPPTLLEGDGFLSLRGLLPCKSSLNRLQMQEALQHRRQNRASKMPYPTQVLSFFSLLISYTPPGSWSTTAATDTGPVAIRDAVLASPRPIDTFLTMTWWKEAFKNVARHWSTNWR